MADKEAKVKFKADTSEFQDGIKAANSEMSSLRSEMKLNEAQFENTGDKTEYLEKKQSLLEAQLEANQDKQAALNSEIEIATQIFGEDSEEVAKLERQLNYTAAQEEQLQSQIAQVTSEIEANESASGQLTATISEQQTELAALKDEYVNAVLTYGENSEEAQRLAEEIASLSGELAENKQQLDEARSAADEFDNSIEEASEGCSDSVGEIKDVLVAAGIADLLSDIGEAAIDMAVDFDDATAVIVEGTGATGEALEELQDATLQSFSNMKNADADLNDVAGVVAELNTRLGITGDTATETADKVLSFAQHTGTDGVKAVDSIVDVMHRWGIEEQDVDALLDDLVTSNQACSLSVDEMTGYLTKNSTQFQELGYSVEDALAFMTSLADGGANTSSVMSGLTKAVSNLSDVTDDVPSAFQLAIDTIGECDTVSEALQTTVGNTGLTVEDVFGKRAAQEIAACVQNGNMNIASFSEALQGNQGVLDETAEAATTMSDEMSRATNNIASTFDSIFGPSITAVVGFVADLVAGFGDVARDSPVLQGVVVALATAFGILAAALAISALINAVTAAVSGLNLAFLACPVTWVVLAIAALVAAFVVLWNNCEEFRGFWEGLWDSICSFAENAWNFINNNVIQPLCNGFQGFCDFINTLFTDPFALLRDAGSNIVSFIQNTFPGATAVFQSAASFWESLFRDPFGTLRNAVSDIVNWVTNNFKLPEIKFPDIKLPHFSIKGSFSLNPISIPTISIDWYAKGAVLNEPTIFGAMDGSLLGGGEAGPEAIAPVSTLQSYIISAVQTASNNDADRIVSAIDDLKSRVAVFEIDGKQFATATASAVDSVGGTRTALSTRGLAL